MIERFEALISKWLGGTAAAGWVASVILLAATVALFMLCWMLLNRVVQRVQSKIDEEEGILIKSLMIQRQRLFSQRQIVHLLHQLITFLSWLAKILLVLIFGNAAFSYFPWTERLALAAFAFMWNLLAGMATALIAYLPSLAIIIVVLLISRFVIRLMHMIAEGIRAERIKLPGFYPEWSETSFNLARILVIALTIIIVFPYLPGSGSPAFQGLSIFFGVLLSLGSSSAIANVIAGIVITYTRAIQIGDRVKISDTEGDVVERSAFVTRIRTPKNVEVAIPNSMVMNDHIINYSAQARAAGLLLHTTITIGYDVPWKQVHELLIEAASRTEKVLQDPPPFVLQTALDDHYVAYELNVCTREASGKQRVYSDLHANIQDCFREADVEILSPEYRANRDGNAKALPPSA